MTDQTRTSAGWLRPGSTAVVVGAGGGIGAALLARLVARTEIARIEAWTRNPLVITRDVSASDKVRASRVDIRSEESIARAADIAGIVDLVVVATGALHLPDGAPPEKSMRDLDATRLIEAFAINAVGPALVAKHLLPRLPRAEPSAFAVLSARVGSISDNRLGGWYGYRASKAALNQFVRTLAIETARTRPRAVCVALHPGTVDTRLSQPFHANVAEGRLFTPDSAAGHLLAVIDGLTPADTGGFLAWDGTPIPL